MAAATTDAAGNPALALDADAPAGEGLALAQFAAGCFWSVELVYQRLPGVARTEVGYTQGHLHEPTYKVVCGGGTGHAEVVRVHYDPNECPYDLLLDVFWAKHNPTTLNRQARRRAPAPAEMADRRRCEAGWANLLQGSMNLGLGNDVGTQYRSGIYYYTPEQEKLARESMAAKQKEWKETIVTEILPARRFYPAEEYHQQYLEKGGQSAKKLCNDPIRCYG
ncbi:hypothetical protein EJB05_39060 [Eragrostis curvula]|uniref:peptide-methionine (S)-S-oxide reductase n=1 Tax=Eragrostis curvula TaxID=38414 RepID=A0A5J9TVS6_9POAL|nr:hypothetical protein EJB05_39037 [Eragrostis curvula]TVU15535.1 hypothetical protein EJB05_39060 [Eragrostis curvula]